jgi:exopolysaccharide production protein ExoQ
VLIGNRRDRVNALYALVAFVLAGFPAASLTILWLFPRMIVVEAMLWTILAALTLMMLRRDRQLGEFARLLRKNWTLLPFVVFAVISIYWSVAAQISLLRWIVLVATIVVGGYIGLNLDAPSLARTLAAYAVLILVMSTLLVAFVPTIGVMYYHIIQGAWKGIYWHKNHMGLMAAFASVLFLVNGLGAFGSRRRSRWWWAALYVLSLLFVSQTDSAAAYLALISLHGLVLVLLGYLKLRARLRRVHYVLLGVVALLAALVLYANIGRVFGAFNRSTNLTGRVPMWGYLFHVYINQRPALGYGFNAFWYTAAHRNTMQQLAGYPDPIIISDNGFIDILVNTGYVGLGLFLVFYLHFWARSIGLARRAKEIYGFFPLIVAAYTLVANVSWSLLFENESVFMLLMVALMFSMSSHPPGELQEDIPDP